MTELFYLKTNSSDSQTMLKAHKLHVRFHTDPPETVKAEEFTQLYREVATTSLSSLDVIEAEWSGDDVDPRSLAVGDIVHRDGQHFAYTPRGWHPVELLSSTR